jgi:hypothetical protein
MPCGYGKRYTKKGIVREYKALRKQGYKSFIAAGMIADKYVKSSSRIYAIMSLRKKKR